MRIEMSGAANVLTGIRVKAAMRRSIVRLAKGARIGQAIACTLKYKVGAVVVTDDAGAKDQGVVSKTDLMGAYYAGLPVETALSDIMAGPPLLCREEDTVESAIDAMKRHDVHRLYVTEGDTDEISGVLALMDIVGLLYRYCHRCDRNRFMRGGGGTSLSGLLTVADVMTPSVHALPAADSLYTVMELLSARHIGAVLIGEDADRGAGVVSKTDLLLAFGRGVSPVAEAGTVMSSPVHVCREEEPLHGAIRKMIFADVDRLFVCGSDGDTISGILTLTDTARARSGSCQACTASRVPA